jgi:collagen beta-1,O-galactosyltransferase
VIASGYDKVLIFEDDIRFEPFFVAKLENLVEELEEKRGIWDLVFLGIFF